MKTLLIRVGKVADPEPYPVELYFESGAQDWFRHIEHAGSLARNPRPLQLRAQAGGAALPIDQIVRFLLTHPQSVGYLDIGGYLYSLLHDSGIGQTWDRLRNAHAAPQGEGLRTVLDIEPSTLKPLPWETLMREGGRALFLDPDNPVVRGPINFSAELHPYLVPLRILVVVGEPDDDTLNWQEEVDAIHTGLLGFKGRVEAKFLLGPTPEDLFNEAEKFTPEVLHFIGHGIESVRPCAWHGRTVHYVRFPNYDYSTLNLLQVLRTIRDGSSGSFVSQPLPAAARDRLTHDLNSFCHGVHPQSFNFNPANHPLKDTCDTWQPGELIDAVFRSLIDVLRTVAEPAPLILALDQFEKVEDSAREQLATYFLKRIARGDIERVRVVVALQSAQLQERWWPADLTGMAREVVVSEIEGDFEALAREYVQHLGYELEESKWIIEGYSRKVGGGTWKPWLLDYIRGGLEAVGTPRRN